MSYRNIWLCRSHELPFIQRFIGGEEAKRPFVFIAGSSWPQDEEILIPYFNKHPEMKLIIAPHGGQSLRERTTWISTNVLVNAHFHSKQLAIIDIAPSISRFLHFEVPNNVLWEQDGIPFIGSVDISDLKTMPYDNTVLLT